MISLLVSSISLPKLIKIQTLAKIYQFLIELPGCRVNRHFKKVSEVFKRCLAVLSYEFPLCLPFKTSQNVCFFLMFPKVLEDSDRSRRPADQFPANFDEIRLHVTER